MRDSLVPSLATILVYLLLGYTAFAAPSPCPQKNYLIGNSLTWDTIPEFLSGDTQWHVDCGKPLPYIFANPEKPCVKSSTIWTKALQVNQYDQISIQPHYGSNLKSDLEIISQWIELQPGAEIIIHTGWAFHAERQEEFTNPVLCEDIMQHSPVYFDELLKRLRKKYPDRKIRRTLAMDLLQLAHDDILNEKSPLKSVSELYRDKIHMTHEGGRYLMHNAMRHALGQPLSSEGFSKTSPQLKAYLDTLLIRAFSN